jgi:hypothetical protein
MMDHSSAVQQGPVDHVLQAQHSNAPPHSQDHLGNVVDPSQLQVMHGSIPSHLLHNSQVPPGLGGPYMHTGMCTSSFYSLI